MVGHLSADHGRSGIPRVLRPGDSLSCRRPLPPFRWPAYRSLAGQACPEVYVSVPLPSPLRDTGVGGRLRCLAGRVYLCSVAYCFSGVGVQWTDLLELFSGVELCID
ncbi:uncharacterized protein BO95DRAFT_29740 [Aspergillus brunneoviolaceus CBS 621.78]|uniref:Uncharacterized protein n=1 Tax=Aspergillus brunneoviolaceus CBS 621.78 TaxID=1450534 RepID=A0ACD1FT05_9EURO|nr:hypothetical protein BO95DRAFT_29740 [Aspergillus brunneoviolaceus CBS 621.78]RAH40115.1 hypothetical protein BO95DRAFT_29740 [Aspergillus brunneoviolaceus CBS 621.78]